MQINFVFLGCLFGLLSVALGAFGAHALAATLTERMREIFETAVKYQMYHALALIGLGLWMKGSSSNLATAAGVGFALGILIFSGSLYVLALTEVRKWGMVTPIGGLAFLVGWACWAIAALKNG
ncbi:MAG: DUF423 domain-containing protein [Bdellovibrionota bacterium]